MATEYEASVQSPSSSDDEMDDMMMFPITDLAHDADVEDTSGDSHGSDPDDDNHVKNSDKNKSLKPAVSLRQRRRSRLGITGEFSKLNLNINHDNRFHSTDSGFDEGACDSTSAPIGSPKVSAIWLKALRKIKSIKDPWEDFHIENYEEETCIRHRYNALKKVWKTDTVKVKVEKKEFNRGAMRSCFRMKKQSTFTRHTDWRRAYNYVAKRYMENVDRSVYFEDVKLQMDAKLWGEEYNRHNPPKKVDIMQMCAIEFTEREGKPLYHLEHFIEGKYIKYNSNSGFVDESYRYTPQAFSHFTFEKSGHNVIVVDIQGVGDLWTDPQIHTAFGDDYGDGNLGTRGMALFFHSHQCNRICHSLNLSGFDLSPQEISIQGLYKEKNTTGHTALRGKEEHVFASPCDRSDISRYLIKQRSRTSSMLSDIHSECSEADSVRPQVICEEIEPEDADEGIGMTPNPSASNNERSAAGAIAVPNHKAVNMVKEESEKIYAQSAPQRSSEDHWGGRMMTSEDEPLSPMSPDSYSSGLGGGRNGPRRVGFLGSEGDGSDLSASITRFRTNSEMSESSEHGSCADDMSCSSMGDVITPEEEAEILRKLNLRNHRASCVADEISFRKLNNLKTIGDSVLGQVHHDLAKYHELGRFKVTDNDDIDWKAALFHEKIAADLGVMEAIITIAKLYLGHQPDVLVNCPIAESDENDDQGVEYMELAAELGDRPAMLYMAKAFETGNGLGKVRTLSNKYAFDWYEKALHYQQEDEDGNYDATMDDPSYQIKAKMAELILAGGPGLEKDPNRSGELYTEAADEAMAAMKGRLANKYYALAEEAWAECPEEEEENGNTEE